MITPWGPLPNRFLKLTLYPSAAQIRTSIFVSRFRVSLYKCQHNSGAWTGLTTLRERRTSVGFGKKRDITKGLRSSVLHLICVTQSIGDLVVNSYVGWTRYQISSRVAGRRNPTLLFTQVGTFARTSSRHARLHPTAPNSHSACHWIGGNGDVIQSTYTAVNRVR